MKLHKTLRISPAMTAGIADRPRSMQDIVATIDVHGGKPGMVDMLVG